MKNRVKSHNRLAKLTSLVLTAAMSVTLVPNIVGTKEVKADDSGIGLEPLDYVMLGTSKMASPAEPNRGKVWDGSYVYFGNYKLPGLAGNYAPLKYRVLDPHTDIYGSKTMFIESNCILDKDSYQINADDSEKPNDYNSSLIRANLNGDKFFLNDDYFTSFERAAVIKSTIGTHARSSNNLVQADMIPYNQYYAPLEGDYVFLLDMEDYCNDKYGYLNSFCNDTSFSSDVLNRYKPILGAVDYESYYTRSAVSNGDLNVAYVASNGYIWYSPCTYRYGVCPAMNISLDKILFSRLESGVFGQNGASYTLSIIDDTLELYNHEHSITDNKIQVTSYQVSGTADAVTLAVFVTDKEYNADDAEIYFLSDLSAEDESVTLPEALKGEWGTDYHVYLIAYQSTPKFDTLRVCKPVEILKSSTEPDPSVSPTAVPPTATEVPPTATATATPTPTVTDAPATATPTQPATPTNVQPTGAEPTGAEPEPTGAEPTVLVTPTPMPDAMRRFVQRLYTCVLGRDSEREGENYWVGQLYRFKQTGGEVAQGFIFSDEFINRNTSDKEFVEILYRTFFDREPDEDGMKFWLNVLSTKEMDRTAVANGFIYSQEWADTCAKFGIRSGGDILPKVEIEPGYKVYNFVERLYTTALGRQSEEEGLNFWAEGLANYRCSAEQVGRDFFLSAEMESYKLSNEEFVTRLYATFMDREPDEDGLKYWVEYLGQGHTREEAVFGFTRSDEFVELCIDARVFPY